jgi:hypothetical protein
MRAWRKAATTILATGLLAGAHGCSAKPPGQILLAVQTDLSLPKDIDTIRIEVFNEGVPKYHKDFERIGDDTKSLRLPATIGLNASPNASDAITIVISARSGGLDGDVRIVREVVTTIPTDRVATLEIPLEFLCEGYGKLSAGNPASACPVKGQTCVAGVCVDDKIDSTKLPTYTVEQVFGDGSCFDASACWGDATPAVLDPATCSIPGATDINVGLQTEGEGICGPVGCFVTLDAASSSGWKIGEGGRITLPTSVCDQVTAGKIVNVVTAPATTACKQKKTALPTCGPWSSATNNPAPYAGPLALSGGQARPVSLVIGGGNLYWTNGGLGMGATGSLKAVGPGGGTPIVIASMTNQAPRDLVVGTVGTDAFVFWTSAPGTPASGAIYKAPLLGGTPTALVSGLDVPEGIATGGGELFWADFQGGGISEAPLAGGASKQIAQGNYPYRVVADDTFVYWTNEGTAGMMPADGSVSRFNHAAGGGAVEAVAPMQDTPRALARDADAGGVTQAIYWATFGPKGALMRAKISASGVAPAEVLAPMQNYPNGIAVDDVNVYWTNRGDGTVLSLPKTANAGDAPVTVASGQLAPGAIAADADFVYWVNEGSSSVPSGAIIKLPKTP